MAKATACSSLLEPSLADAVLLIQEAPDLDAQTKQRWVRSLRNVAQAMDKPREIIPARYSAVRAELRKLHHVPLGITAKTLANDRSGAKSALLWLHDERSLPRNGVPLSPLWERLHRRLEKNVRYRLSPMMRFCSAKGIAPHEVNETVVDDYLAYRRREMARRTDQVTHRVLARLWNANVGKVDGWPSKILAVPDVKKSDGPALEEFPLGLREDFEKVLQSLQKPRRSKTGQRLHPCAHSTITTRRREFALLAKQAAKLVPIETLTSMKCLLKPEILEQVLSQYWRENQRPTQFAVELATHSVSAARLLGFDHQELERLNEIREHVQSKAPKKGFTEKNRKFVRQILSGKSWKAILALPAKLMALARACRTNAPESAAVYAQMAVAIGILSFAPIRRGNLAKIRLDVNLTKPGGPDSHYWLGFPEYDVKNRVDLTFQLKSPELNAVINEYVHDFRPILLRGHNHDWLFPGLRGEPKEPTSFATQMVKIIFKHAGLRMTVHQFRHAAGALLLQKYPGNYELVRRVLGHKSVQTTIDFYAEFENWQASALFQDIVIEHMMEPEGSYRNARTSRRGPKPNQAAFPMRR